MAYRAGSAYLAVYPSFRGLQTKIAAKAKTLQPIKVPVEYDHKKLIVGQPKPVKVKVDADTTAANEKIRQTTRPRKTTVGVDADTGAAHAKLTALQNRLRAMSTGRTLIQVGIVAAPLAIPAAAGLVGGGAALGGIAAGVAGGLGAAAAVGLSQLTKARQLQKDLATATDQRKTALAGVKSAEESVAAATTAAARTQLQSTRAIADATRGVADARRNAARVARDSARQVEAAERALGDAQDRVVDAEAALHDARAQAVRDLQDLTARVRENANAQEAADLSLIAAKERLALAEENIFTSATDMRAARLGVAEAEAKVAETRRQGQRDAEDLAKIERDGVDGTAGVRAAKEQLQRAKEDRARAQTELVQARVSAQEARADAARQVADAERGLARAKVDAAAAEADAQRQVADAQAGLADAQADLATAEAARLAVLQKLTPAQKRMLAGLASLQAAWGGFLHLVDRPLGGAMVSAMGALEDALPGLAAFLKPVLRSLRGVFDMLGDAAASKGAKRFARDFGVFSGGVLKDAGKGTRNLVAGFGSLLRAFMPLSKDMSKGLVGLTKRFRVWAAGLGDSKGFKRFIGYIRENGPLLLSTLGAVGGALIAVGKALAPLATKLLEGLKAFAGWVDKTAEAHPQLVRIVAVVALLSAGFGLVVKMLLPVIRLVSGVVRVVIFAVKWIRIIAFNLRILFFVLRANPIGMVITVIALLVAGLILAYKKSETFRRIVDGAWSGIKKAVSVAWNSVLKPVFGALRDFVADTLPNAFRTGADAIGRFWNGLKALAAKPVNFLIDTVYNNGIRKLINAIPFVDDIPKLGTVSWGGGYSKSGGTGIASAAAKNDRILTAAEGGPVFGGVPGKDSVRALLMPGEHVWTTREVAKAGGHKVMAALRRAVLRGGLGRLFDPDPPRFATGGALSAEQIARAQAFARAQEGKPYVWGSAGPTGYDCSGFMSAITNMLRGLNPFSRVGATGTFPWAGFKPGVGQFTIGSTANYGGSGVGHMAGTLGGLNVESRGGQGVVLGAAARGYNDAGFTTVAHLGAGGTKAAKAGGFFSTIKAIGGLVTDIRRWVSELTGMGGWAGLIRQMVGGVLGGMRGWVNDKIPGPGPIPAVFDGGGMLEQGMLAYHGARKPDRVLTDGQWRDIHAAATAARGRGSVFELYDVDGQLIGRMRGEARRVVAGDRDFAAAQAGAGMGGRG